MQNLKLKFFRQFFNYFLISLALLIVSHITHLPPLLGLALGIAPLMIYHFFFLSPKAKKDELTQPAIDSVYYFGFLITVASLGLSAVSIATSGDETDFNNVIFQFGVGLIATGYAVIARMHLISIQAQADAKNTEEAMESFVKRSMTLTQAVDEATTKMETLTATLIERTKKMHEENNLEFQNSMKESAHAFKNELQSIFELTQKNMSEISSFIAESQLKAERMELAESVKANISATNDCTESLMKYKSQIELTNNELKLTASASDTLNTALIDLKNSTDDLSSENGGINKLNHGLTYANVEMMKNGQELTAAYESLNNFRLVAQDSAPAFKVLRTGSKKVQDQLAELDDILVKFKNSLMQISNEHNNTEIVLNTLANASKIMPTLDLSITQLNDSFHKTNQIVQSVNQELTALPSNAKSINEHNNLISESVSTTVNAFEQIHTHSTNIVSSANSIKLVYEETQNLIDNTKQLKDLIAQISTDFSSFSSSLKLANSTIEESAKGIKASIGNSSKELEDDLKRSTEAAGLLTHKLIDIAEAIIEKTNTKAQVNDNANANNGA